MTVGFYPGPQDYTGTGEQAAFPTVFKFYDADQVQVYIDGVLQLGTYTVTGGDGDNGSVFLLNAPVLGSQVQVRRFTNRQQSFFSQSNPNAENAERQLDLLTMMLQEIDWEVENSTFRFIAGTSASAEATVPAPVDGRVLKWEGGKLSNSEYDPDLLADNVETALTDSASALVAASQAVNTAATALAVAQEPLGAARHPRQHTLAAGVQSYECAPSGTPWPSVNSGSVFIDGLKQRAGIDYTLAVDGLSIVLTGTVVASDPAANEWAAGLVLETEFQVVGVDFTQIQPNTIITSHVQDGQITYDKLGTGPASSLPMWKADQSKTALALTQGKVPSVDGSGNPVAATLPVAASQSEMRAGVETAKFVAPAVLRYNMGIARQFIRIGVNPNYYLESYLGGDSAPLIQQSGAVCTVRSTVKLLSCFVAYACYSNSSTGVWNQPYARPVVYDPVNGYFVFSFWNRLVVSSPPSSSAIIPTDVIVYGDPKI